MGARPVYVPLREYVHDLEAMADAVGRAPRCCSCATRTTRRPGGGRGRVRLLDRVPERVLVVVDEATPSTSSAGLPDTTPSCGRGARNVWCCAASPRSTAWRGCGWATRWATPDLVAYLDRARPVFNVNSLAQVAGLAALEDREHVRRSREHAAACRALFARGLAEAGARPVPSEANFVAAEVGDDAAVAAGLLERGFAVTALRGWDVPGLRPHLLRGRCREPPLSYWRAQADHGGEPDEAATAAGAPLPCGRGPPRPVEPA
jgi:histidinol-phosphate aminotransferase